MSPEAQPYLPRGVRLHYDKVRSTWVLLAPERTVTLDEIGHAILSLVDGARRFGEICATLAARYAAPEAMIAQDASAFLATLQERRFLEVR